MRLLHHSKNPIVRVHSTQQPGAPDHKPLGFWVSVEGEDDWRQWCMSEGYALDCFEYETVIVLSDSANILRLWCPADIDAFHEGYSVQDRYYRPKIDWARVAEEYQGIIIAPYCWQRRLDGPAHSWYYGWDCASGCIWDAEAIAELVAIKEAA